MSLEKALRKAIDDGVMPGVVVLAADASGTVSSGTTSVEQIVELKNITIGKTIIETTLGKRSAASSTENDMHLNTVFTIASMTKLLTAICVLQLVERKQVTLDEDITSHVPILAKQRILTAFDANTGSPIFEDRKGSITLRHLLTHTAGTGTEYVQPLLKRFVKDHRPHIGSAKTVDERCDLPLLYQPGEGWSYGSGVTWAGKVVESATGVGLEEYMRKNIFKQLGIEGITFFPRRYREIEERLTGMTTWNPSTGRLEDLDAGLPGRTALDRMDAFGGEGAFADLGDFFKVVRSLLVDDEVLLKKETAALIFEPQIPTQAGRDGLRNMFADPTWLPGDFEGPNEYDWSAAGLLVVGDGHEFRRRGCCLWIGAAHTFWVSCTG